MITSVKRFLKGKLWARHLTFWIGYTLMMFAFNLWKSGKVQLWGTILIAGLLAATFYCLFFLMIRLIDKRTRMRALGLLMILLILLPFLAKVYITDVIPAVGGRIQKTGVSFKLNEFMQNYAISFYRVAGYAFMFFLYRMRRKAEREAHALEIKSLKAERERANYQMRLYRAQIYPHFQRNTLESIITRVKQYQDDAVVGMLENLMAVSNYALKYSREDVPTVFVSKELDFIKSLVELMRKEAGDSAAVQLAIVGELQAQVIPPLCLLTFMENVWKHGFFSASHPMTAKIELMENRFSFYCKNFKKNISREAKEVDEGGFGLKNIQYRLHAVFDNQFNLDTEDEPTTFAVKLTINY